MKKTMDKFRANFAATRDSERGDIVQTLLIIVTFVIIVIAVLAVLWKAIGERADGVADCITGANPVSGSHDKSNC